MNTLMTFLTNGVFQNTPYFLVLFILFLLMFLFSIIPLLPLFIIITFNFFYFGYVLGFLISWIATVLGCIASYKLSRYIKLPKFVLKNKNYKRIYNNLNSLDVERLTLIMALPFSPAFLINIVAGYVNYPEKNFLKSLVVSKVSIVYFWGFIGSTLLESLSSPKVILKILALLLVTYYASKKINKKIK